MTKKGIPAPALQSMTKPELGKINRELKDLRAAADDGSTALASAYKKLKKRGINLEAFKLSEKLNRLDNPAKIQSFLADFDRLRELHGWDDQSQLFDDDKTRPQKEAEKAAKTKPKSAAEKKADKKAGELAAKSNAAVNKRSEKAAAKQKGSRVALFGESSDGDDAPVH